VTPLVPHFPGRAPIEAYGAGRFAFAGMQHAGAILVLPSGIRAWDVATFDDLTMATFDPVVAEASAIDYLMIGTGDAFHPLPPAIAWRLKDLKLRVDVSATGAAIRTYNVLLAEARRAAAALLPVY
jgi:uncharacterized protein